MVTNEKLELLADIFEMEVDSLDLSVKLADLPNWNSMTRLSLIVLFDDEFEKKLTGEQIKKFSTIKDIIDYME